MEAENNNKKKKKKKRKEEDEGTGREHDHDNDDGTNQEPKRSKQDLKETSVVTMEVDKESKEWTGKDLAKHARQAMKQNVSFTFGFDLGGQNDNLIPMSSEGGGPVDGVGGAQPAANQDSRVVYVGGLPYEVTDVEIEQFFSEFGQVERIDKLKFQDSGRFNGIAFVCFDSGRSAKKALSANGRAFYDDDRFLVVRKYISGGNGAEKKREQHAAPVERKRGYNRVYVGNLPWSCTDAELREWFQGAGCEIKFLRMGTDKDGNFRGFAHLHFATDACVDKALALSGEYWDDRQVKVSPAVPPKR